MDKKKKGGIQGPLSVWVVLIWFSAGEAEYVYVIVWTAGN